MTVSRFDLNGTADLPEVTVKPKRARKQLPVHQDPAPKPRKGSKGAHKAEGAEWAQWYVIAACVLSSGLNALANWDTSINNGVGYALAAALLGACIPGLVWLCFKSAAHAYKSGSAAAWDARHKTALAVASAGVALLILSVWHCAHAICLLTGCPMFAAVLMSLGIDWGLVVNEWAAIQGE